MNLRERQIRDKACTVCDGLRPWGKGFRAVSKERCDTCKNGSNWKLKHEKTKFSESNPYFRELKPNRLTATEIMMKVRTYKWYQKILLAFLPMRYVGDDEFGIYYKRWRGNTFVYRIKRGRKPTLIFQDEVVNGS